MNLTKDNTLLVEFHPEKDKARVKEMHENSEGKTDIFFGYGIHTVYDGHSELLAKYDFNLDRTDLSCLTDKEGFNVVCVSKTEYDQFIWKRFVLGVNMDDQNLAFTVKEGQDCTEEETKFLDETYPEYRENAF